MIQIRNISAPVLRLVKRVVALDARATNAASSPAERVIARLECEKLCDAQGLAVTRMFVPAPRGDFRISGASDTVLTQDGVPWWRGQLGLLAAMHAGFGAPKERPWEAYGKNHKNGCFFLKLVGTKRAVETARMLYATAESVATSYMPSAPAGRLDEYLCGVSMAIGLAFEAAYARDQMRLDQQSRKALVVYIDSSQEPGRSLPTTLMGVPEGELDVLAVAADQDHPVREGFDLAKRDEAGGLVLGELPRTRSKLTTLLRAMRWH